jgi:sulfur-carrier protein
MPEPEGGSRAERRLPQPKGLSEMRPGECGSHHATDGRRVSIVYFAWVREKIGFQDEAVTLPAQIETVETLIDWLAQRSPRHASLRDPRIRCAVDQLVVRPDAKLEDPREIAFFPPVTGG